MSAPTHPNEDEYSALLTVSTTKHYPFQWAEVADMKAERKHDSHGESCALNPATQAVPIAIGTAWVAAQARFCLL